MGQGKSTTYGYWRQRGDTKSSSFPGVSLLAMPFEKVLTATGGAHSIGTLPKGAIPLFSQSWGGDATAGAPTINIGLATDGVVTPTDGITQGLLTESYGTFVTGGTAGGAKLGNALGAQGVVYLINSEATGGAAIAHTADGAVYYVMDDDGV